MSLMRVRESGVPGVGGGEITFSSRGKDRLFQWKFLHGNFQGRRSESGKVDYLFLKGGGFTK